jgi:hypothetical protein
MRNYVKYFWAAVDWDVENPPNPPFHRQQGVWAPTQEELDSNVAEFISFLPNPPNDNFAVTNKGPIYWLLDHANLDNILNFAFPQTTSNILSGFNPGPWVTLESPRSTGFTDVEGTKIDPPPSEAKTPPVSGPQVPNIKFNSLAQFLQTLYALTYQRGCFGYAKTILSAVQKALKGTITQADVDRASDAYNACIGQ